jgi:ATP-dependent protease ClpP protease subunit
MVVRRMCISGDINDEVFLSLSLFLDSMLIHSKTKPVVLTLCSTGGSEVAAFAIYGKIRSMPYPIHIECFGAIYSAAILVLAAGDRRAAHELTTFLVHDSRHELGAITTTTMAQATRAAEASERLFYATLGSRTKLPYSVWAQKSLDSVFFGAKQAMEWGLISSIIGGSGEKD